MAVHVCVVGFVFLLNMFVYWHYFWNLVTQRLQLEQTLLNQVCFLCILLLLLCLFSSLKWLFSYKKKKKKLSAASLAWFTTKQCLCYYYYYCHHKMFIFVFVCRLRWIVCWVVMTICLNHILPVRLRYYYCYYCCCDVFLIHFFFCSCCSIDSATATAFLFHKPLYTYQRSKW